MKWVNQIVRTGTQSVGNIEKVKQIRLVNLISLCFSSFAVFYIAFFGILGFEIYSLILIPVLLGYLSPIFFNKRNLYLVAALSLVFWCHAAGTLFGLAFGAESGIHIVIFGFSCTSFLFFNVRKPTPYLLSLFVSLPCILAIHFSWIAPWEEIVEPAKTIINVAMILTTGIIIWLSLRYLLLENRRAIESVENQKEALSLAISEKEAAVNDQEKLILKLQRKNEDLDEFAFIVSHDLKAPLVGIEALISFLSKDLNADNVDLEKVERSLSLLENRSTMLQRVVEGVLHFSRAGRDSSQKDEIKAQEMLSELESRISLPEGFEIVKEISTDSFVGDKIKVYQSVQNLLTNAVKHHKDPNNGRIFVRVFSDSTNLIIEVEDNGPGIDERYQERIFKLFEKLDQDNPSNSGIGLSVVKKMTESQGGSIRLESELGKGSTFTIKIPLNLS